MHRHHESEPAPIGLSEPAGPVAGPVAGPCRTAGPARRLAVITRLMLLATVLAAGPWIQGCGPATYDDLVTLEPLPYTPIDLGQAGNPALATIFKLGMVHYESRDWPAAFEQLSRADRMLRADPRSGPPNQPLFPPLVSLYRGISQLLAGQTRESLAILDELSQPQVARPLRERALWYGVQARLKLGDGAGALPSLGELNGSPVYGESAPALAAKIKDRLKR